MKIKQFFNGELRVTSETSCRTVVTLRRRLDSLSGNGWGARAVMVRELALKWGAHETNHGEWYLPALGAVIEVLP